MVVYSGYVATPANSTHGTDLRPRLEIRLVEEAHHGGTLINTDVRHVNVPVSGAYTVDLIPCDQLRTRSGRLALYQITETWLAGDTVRSRSDWGSFYLTSAGGTLSDHATLPAGVRGVYVVETEDDLPPLVTGDIVIITSTGEIKQEVA